MKKILILLLAAIPFMVAAQNRYEEIIPMRKPCMAVPVTIEGQERYFMVAPERASSAARKEVAPDGELIRLGVGQNLFIQELPVEVAEMPEGMDGLLGRDAFALSVLTIDSEKGYITLSAPYKPTYMPLRNRTELVPVGDDIAVSTGGELLSAPLDSLLKKGVVTFDFPRGKTYFELHEKLQKPENPVSTTGRKDVPEGDVAHLNTTEFLTVVHDFRAGGEWRYKGTEPCVIDFWATWCAPCLKLSPLIDAFAKEYSGRVKFYKVNVDEEREVAAYFDVVAIPLLVFIPMDGSPQPVLATSEEEIRRNIELLLENTNNF